jgi:hypothetical protein
MTLKKLKTNYRAWLISSLILFVVPSALCWRIYALMFVCLTDSNHAAEGFGILFYVLVYLAIPATLCGWVAQALIVVVVSVKRRKLNHAA